MVKKELELQNRSEVGKNIHELIEIAKIHLPATKETTDEVKKVFKYLIVFLGIRPENHPDEGERMVILDYISRYVTISLLDLKNAFTLYVQHKLDYVEPAYQNLTVPLIENVIQSYRRYCNNLPNKPSPQLTEKTPPSNEEVFKIMVHGAITCFETYIKTGQLIDLGNVNYDFLSKEEHIKFTDGLKWQFYNQAKEALKAEKLGSVMTGKETTPLQKLLNEIEGNHFDVVVKKAKKIALEEYFKGLIEMEMTLHEVLGVDVPNGIVFNSTEKKQPENVCSEQLVSQKTWLEWFDENFASFTRLELHEMEKQLVNGSIHGANEAQIMRINSKLKEMQEVEV